MDESKQRICSCSTSSRDGKGKASQPGKRCRRQPEAPSSAKLSHKWCCPHVVHRFRPHRHSPRRSRAPNQAAPLKNSARGKAVLKSPHSAHEIAGPLPTYTPSAFLGAVSETCLHHVVECARNVFACRSPISDASPRAARLPVENWQIFHG